jgi:hypothetical protein
MILPDILIRAVCFVDMKAVSAVVVTKLNSSGDGPNPAIIFDFSAPPVL